MIVNGLIVDRVVDGVSEVLDRDEVRLPFNSPLFQ